MGKTFRRDNNWNHDRERNFRRQREIMAAARRAAREADESDETYSVSGETNGDYWENRNKLRRK